MVVSCWLGEGDHLTPDPPTMAAWSDSDRRTALFPDHFRMVALKSIESTAAHGGCDWAILGVKGGFDRDADHVQRHDLRSASTL